MSELTTPIPDAGPHLTMEPGMDLDIEIVGTQTRQRGHFVGMEPGHYLILAVPEAKTNDDMAGKFVPGKPVAVDYFYRGTAYHFESPVLATFLQPAHLIILRYPRTIEERRIEERRRVDCYLPVRLKLGDRLVDGTVTDISATGCRCRLKNATLAVAGIGLDTIPLMLAITFPQPDDQPELTLNTAIRNRQQDREKTEMGLEFLGLSDELRRKLARSISNIENDSRG
jgi:c-di-GMP-binding flagellar brake protein YcgR